MNFFTNTKARSDRAVGSLVGLACGDALGAAYEFGGPIPDATQIGMIGGGPFNWEPGEWTDDTSMAIPIAQEIAQGHDLCDPDTLGRIVGSWKAWASTAKDVGSQTRSVLSSLSEATEEEARIVAEAFHQRNNRSGGNGALMRTAPVGYAYLSNPHNVTIAARRIAQLTHWEDDASDACILWSHAIGHAIVTNKLDIRIGLQELNKEARATWLARIEEAEAKSPADFHKTNGWVVSAFQGAWSAIHHGVEAGEGFEGIVERAVRGGGDTDTVAAIAGSLAGAYFGVSRIPAKWRRVIHGWPGMNYRDLLNLVVVKLDEKNINELTSWPVTEFMQGTHEDVLVQHPHDEGVWMASIKGLESLPEDVEAVISMCRVGTNQVPGKEVIEFWLIDHPGENLDTEYVLKDAANTIAELRAKGKQVVVHCVAAHNRTPAVAVAYSILHKGVGFEKAWTEVRGALPNPQNNEEFQEVLQKIIE